MSTKRRISSEIWEKLMDKAVYGQVSYREIAKVLKTTPSYFREKIRRTKGVRVYACTSQYLSVARTASDCAIVNERLTRASVGFLRSKRANDQSLFSILNLSDKDMESKVAKDPFYLWAVSGLK